VFTFYIEYVRVTAIYMNLNNILPPSLAQLRETERTIFVSERAIKGLMHEYYRMFLKAPGPRYAHYRKIAKNIQDMSGVPGAFLDKTSFYHIPAEYGHVEEEIMVSETTDPDTGDVTRAWEKWQLSPVLTKSASVWDSDGRIARLSDSERMRINAAVGELMRMIQMSWYYVSSLSPEAYGLALDVCPENITLKLIDASRASKSDFFDYRICVDITIKDKIETKY